MSVASIPSAAYLPPVAAVLPTARVVRGGAPAKKSKTSGAKNSDGEGPIAAMRTPAAASSGATQAALTNITLGGPMDSDPEA